MRIHLSKEIAEFENQNVRHIWQQPDIYESVHNDEIWLVYGRKGSGKSTIVEYLARENHKYRVIVVRPSETDIFSKLITAIDYSEEVEDRLVEESVIGIIDFVFAVNLASKLVSFDQLTAGPSETIYRFFVDNHLHEGSALKKAVDFIAAFANDEFKLVGNFSRVIDQHLKGVTFSQFKDALNEHIKAQRNKLILCIDDIDDVAFSFSRSDRIFIDSLIAYMVRSNTAFSRNKMPIRLLLTAPSEVFFHASLYGGDWVTTKSTCLNWHNATHIRELVHKRIAVEFNIRKRSQRHEHDIYSIAREETWDKLFPPSILNKLKEREDSFSYLLRHTFYTPRHILALTDRLLENVEVTEKSMMQVRQKFVDETWASAHFQSCVEDFTNEIQETFLDLFEKIYDGLPAVLEAFQSRPNIWTRERLLDFVEANELKLVRKDKKDEHVRESLIYTLQRIGFLGLGSRTIDETLDPLSFALRFSFLERVPNRRPYEIAVISPVFYDAYNIQPFLRKIVSPVEPLLLNTSSYNRLCRYDHTMNMFPAS